MRFYCRVLRILSAAGVAALPFVGCSSTSNQPKPLRSYAQPDIATPVLFTVDLEIKMVDANDNPVSGVKVYARNPYFHQFVFTGQSGTAVINGTFADQEMTLFEFEGPGIRWSEELYQDLPAKTKSITLKVQAVGDGSVRLAGLRYFPH